MCLYYLLTSFTSRYCQGRTKGGNDFETFYGSDWDKSVEKKFNEWALRAFGGKLYPSYDSHVHLSHPIKGKGTERREMFLFPTTSSQRTTSEVSPSQEPVPEGSMSTPVAMPHNSSSDTVPPPKKSATESAAPKKSKPRPKPRKPVPQSSTPTESTSQPATRHSPLPLSTSTQVMGVSDPLPANPLPPTDTPDIGADMALFVTALGVRHLLSQVAGAPHAPQASAANTLETPTVVGPFQHTVNPSQLFNHSDQVVVEPSEPAVNALQSVGEMSTVAPILPKTSEAVGTPKTRYRARDPANVILGAPSRRDSIEGAPGMMLGLHVDSGMQGTSSESGPELTVDLSEYINMDGASDDDDETHVSSSQKSIDGCGELSPLPPNTVEEDLPSWMLNHNQWKYIASAAGGPAWVNLLKIYMQQERRLEFRETVGDLVCILPAFGSNKPTHSQRPSLSRTARP